MSWVLLSLVVLPFAGAIFGAFVPPRAARYSALGVSIAVAILSLVLLRAIDFNQDLRGQWIEAQFRHTIQLHFGGPGQATWSIPTLGFSFHLGLDTISVWLVLLTTLLSPLAIIASFASIRGREREYYAWMLALLGAMLGVFVARDLLLFYLFFELTLVPMFFIIGIWGGPQRRAAAGKFFLFTFAGSVFTLAGVVYLGIMSGTFDIIELTDYAQAQLKDPERFWILLAFLAGFAVKVPLFPVHTWLPLAHTEAPTAGSVILAGVLLKLGTYGLMRLAVPLGLLSDQAGVAFPIALKVIAILCIVGIIYGALIAWVQRDIKKLVAYSSVSHLGFCVLGLFALTTIGMQGSILYMINHGLSTGALFLVIGMIYDRYHTRDIDQLSGLSKVMPKMAFFFVFFTLASIGLPGLNGFVSEFLTVLGAFTSDWLGIAYGSFAALGVILGAVYMLHMLARVLFGPLKEPHVAHAPQAVVAVDTGVEAGQVEKIEYAAPGTRVHHMGSKDKPLSRDINAREIAILVPLAVCCLALGIGSSFITRSMRYPVEMLRFPVGMDASVYDDDRPWPKQPEAPRPARGGGGRGGR